MNIKLKLQKVIFFSVIVFFYFYLLLNSSCKDDFQTDKVNTYNYSFIDMSRTGAKLVFNDEFTNSFNLKEWYGITWCDTFSFLNYYLPGNIYGSQDKDYNFVRIESKYEDISTPCGMLHSTSGWMVSKRLYGYGYYEAKVKLSPSGFEKRFCPAFWLYNDKRDAICVFEIDAKTNSVTSNNAIADISATFRNHGEKDEISEEFKVFGIYWTKDLIIYYYDNKIIDTQRVLVPKDSMFVIFNTTVGGAFNPNAKTVNPSAFPYYFDIDYFRYYTERPTVSRFIALDESSNFRIMTDNLDWEDDWDFVLPGNFNNDEITDLFFYKRSEGKAVFSLGDGLGNYSILKIHEDWSREWDQIVIADFGGSNYSDILLYNNVSGKLELCSIDGSINHVWQFSGRNVLISNISASLSKPDDILIYNRPEGEGVILSINDEMAFDATQIFIDYSTSYDKMYVGYLTNSEKMDILLVNSNLGEISLFTISGKKISSYKNQGSIKLAVIGDFDCDNRDELMIYGQDYDVFLKLNRKNELIPYKSLSGENAFNDGWDFIISGQFDGNYASDLMFYDRK